MIFTPIKEVKVYRNSAVIRRCGTAALKQGTNELILSGMGSTADPDSLRLFFPEGVLGTDVQILSLTEAGEALPSRETQAQIEEFENRIAQRRKRAPKSWSRSENCGKHSCGGKPYG